VARLLSFLTTSPPDTIVGKNARSPAQLANTSRQQTGVFLYQGLTSKRVSSNSKSISISSGAWRNDSHHSFHRPTTTKRIHYAR